MNLEKVLDSGPAPVVGIMSPPTGSQSAADLVTVAAHITDKGKGIGRVEWRVNGITTGVINPPTNVGSDYEVKQTLALDPGENAIEVVAYNAPRSYKTREFSATQAGGRRREKHRGSLQGSRLRIL